MEISLAGRTAIVTGGSKGIGYAIATRFVNSGADVMICARGREALDEAVKAIGAQAASAKGGNARGKIAAIAGDVAKPEEVKRIFDETMKTFGKVDILVNNAGVYGFAPLEQLTADEYKRQFDTNVFGLLLTTKAALPLFPAEGGSVINISSVVTALAPPTSAVYSSTKGAVDTITKTLAKELAPRKIRVNAINPGLVITEGTHAAGIVDSDFEKGAVAATPLGRAGQPEDIAPPVSFLASDDARWITGETIFVSGGAAI